MTICAIHQPNFYPWLGYFDKIRQADVFIFLDEVAYPKSGSGLGSWCNRVMLLSEKKPAWYGLPIKRESGVQKINDVEFSNKEFHLKKMLKSLTHNYKKYPAFAKMFSELEPLFHSFHGDNLADYNIHVIQTLATMLGLTTRFVRQSELSHTQASNDLLIELVKQVDADTYLCGNGADGYQQETLFNQAGINVLRQAPYPASYWFQLEDPEEGKLSILHFLLAYEQVHK